MSTLYDTDFYAWTQEQSAKLRQLFAGRINTDLDIENLVEEVESMGGSQRDEVESRLAIILEHLLKLAYSPAPEPRNMWQNSVKTQRIDLDEVLDRNPSLRRLVRELAGPAYRRALRRAEISRISLSMPLLPTTSPFDLDSQVMSDWLPMEPLP